MTMRRNICGVIFSIKDNAAAPVNRFVTVDQFAVASWHRDADSVIMPDKRCEIGNNDEEIFL